MVWALPDGYGVFLELGYAVDSLCPWGSTTARHPGAGAGGRSALPFPFDLDLTGRSPETTMVPIGCDRFCFRITLRKLRSNG